MECLKAEGVDTVFGIPGGANLPTYDALYDAGIRHILCRHEQGAAHEAVHIARTGRPGPVLIDVPQDLSRADINYEPVDDVHLPGYQPTTEGNAKQMRLAAKALANARRPVIYAGGGVINANAAEALV